MKINEVMGHLTEKNYRYKVFVGSDALEWFRKNVESYQGIVNADFIELLRPLRATKNKIVRPFTKSGKLSPTWISAPQEVIVVAGPKENEFLLVDRIDFIAIGDGN